MSSTSHRRIRRSALCLLGATALTFTPAQAAARQLKLTAEITAIGTPQPGGTSYSLKFMRSGKVVGRTLKPLSCNGLAITEVECFGGPIHIQGVTHNFWLSRILWSVPTCTNITKGCPQGPDRAVGDLAAGPNPDNPLAKQPKQIGTIRVSSTQSFGNRLKKPFKVTIRLP